MFPKDQRSLLSVPRNDAETLLLVQLPPSLPIESIHEASIISNKPKAPACLVTRSRSFSISRVETSNALVLIPPTDKCDHLSKKPKTNHFHMPCRLMGKGSGAFFLELKEKNIDIKALEDLMSTFDPYSENPFQGVSLSHLAHELQVSEEQARTGLRTLKAFEYRSEYSLLSEEAHQEARQAIVSTLTECDEFSNYIEGVDFQQMANETVKRVAESYPQLEAVIRLTLRDMSRQGRRDDNIEIDFVKVATFVAHQLFAKSSEWPCDDLLREWQSKVPGVGEAYQVSADLLKGIAIRNGNKWRYLPADKIAKAPKERFEQLFSSKEKWTMDDMIPYLEIFGKRKDEMLQKFAVLVTDQIGSETITSYVKNDNAK